MSYQLYVTGGYGFTESILPSLLHPSKAIDVARDYQGRDWRCLGITPTGQTYSPSPRGRSQKNRSIS